MKAFRVLGTTDDVTTGELCGREELKSTVALQPLDPDGGALGEPVFYGSDCAARAAGWTQKEVRQLDGTADRQREEAMRRRRDAISYGVTSDPARQAAEKVYQARWDREDAQRRQHIPFSERRTWPEHAAMLAAEQAARARLEAVTPEIPAVPSKPTAARGQLSLLAS